MEKGFEVQFQPDGIRISVVPGTLISDAMKTAGIKIQLPCGGNGKCGKCAVEIHPDAPEPGGVDLQYLTGDEIDRGMRLACQTKIDRDMSILVSPNIRVIDGKILIDVNENRYLIPDIRQLSEAEQNNFSRFIYW